MEWLKKFEDGDITHREFILDRDGRPVPGTLWHSESSRPGGPLICFGHGASGDCDQAPIPRLAREFVGDLGFFALAIDGPVHGRRRMGDDAMEATLEEWGRVGCVEDMIADWKFAIDKVKHCRKSEPEIWVTGVFLWALCSASRWWQPNNVSKRRF